MLYGIVCWSVSMNSESTQILKVSRGKRLLLHTIAAVLFVLGTLPSPFVSLSLGSVLPFLGGLYLAFIAYCLLRLSISSLEIGENGIVLGDRRRRAFIPWSDVRGFSQGSGIDHHKVVMSLVSDPAPRLISFGLFQLECRGVRHLPDTSGMKARELIDLLNRAKNGSSRNCGDE